MSQNIFVYGSLKHNFHNHVIIEKEKLISNKAIIPASEKCVMYSLGSFPALVKKDKGYDIVGEVYEVSDKTFPYVDRLEGNPTFYKREEIYIPEVDLKAWVYIFQNMVDENLIIKIKNNTQVWN